MDTAKVPTLDREIGPEALLNNHTLYDQIKLCIISDYFPKSLSKQTSGSMEFFVRDGELAINYHTTKVSLHGAAETTDQSGMNRSKLLTFLSLIKDRINEVQKIDYGSIIISYAILDDYIDGDIEIKTQCNHRRR